jgi:protein O-GlcNAc transferase
MIQSLNEGLTFHKAGKLEEAKKIYEYLLIKNPNSFEITNLLGVIFLQLKKYDEAINLIKKAININPNHHALYNNLGVIYKELEKYSEAIENFKKAVKLNPSYTEAYNNLGVVFKKNYQHEEAYSSYKECIKLNPYYPEAYNNLGLLYAEIKNFKKAILNFNKAIELNDKYIDAYKNRANFYSNDRQYSLAIKDYNKLKTLDSNKEFLYESLIFFIKNKICDWKGYKTTILKLEKEIKKKQIISNPWDLLLCCDSLEVIKNNVNNFNSKNYNLHSSIKIKLNSLKKKIRVAYYSADFRRHPVGNIIENIFESHNKIDFEIIGFYFNKYKDDIITKKISSFCDKFFYVNKMSDQDIISKSRDLKIDIAIDLMGQTGDNRANIFINRISPIQINFLGHAGTVGAHMDYIVADKYLISSKNEKFYFEKIIYMPDCYMPHNSKNEIKNKSYSRAQFNLPESTFVYCCFNNSYKINPLVFNCWMRILKKTKNTVLFLFESNKNSKENLLNEASKREIDLNRIIFSPVLPYEDRLERFKFCDLFLDTFPYSAHSTAIESLSSGVAILSMAGESFQSRIPFSLLKNLEISELAKLNLDDYENYAVYLANNPKKLKEIKIRLDKAIKESNIFNAKTYTKNLERAYKLVHKNFKKGLDFKNIYLE